jgi:signal transduction histidine kinase
LSRHGNKIRQSFSPFYLAVLSGVLLTILIINGLLEISRAKNGFYLLLEREATVLLQHFERNVQDTIASLQLIETQPGHSLNPSLTGSFFGLEESIAEYLVEVAYRIDQIDGERPLTPSDLQSLVSQHSLTSIEIYGPKANRLRAWPAGPPPAGTKSSLLELIQERRSIATDLFEKPLKGGGQWYFIAVSRRETPGIISLHLTGEQVKRLFRQFAIQRAISDISPREGILYVSVQDGEMNILAHTDSTLIGTREDDPFLRSSLQGNRLLTRHRHSKAGEEIFEVSKSFSAKGEAMGLIRIGYSPKEIYPVLSQMRKNVALSIFFFLILGISAIGLIWVNQNRHLSRMREMEDRIRLAERLSSLGHLAAGVAHEIRNPLNAIGMGLQRLKREFLPQEESKKEEYLSFADLILKEIRRVNDIIEQFLTLSRPFQLNLKASSLYDLLKNLVTLFREEASSQGISLQAEIDPALPLVKIDSEKLTQAFINIMKNGMQAMEKGGVLRIETRPFKDRVEVAFSDSGSGIPPEQMEKIFNYYYTTKEKGVGLGLPIAHRIIEAHGGELKLESRVGNGTKVTVTLPAG